MWLSSTTHYTVCHSHFLVVASKHAALGAKALGDKVVKYRAAKEATRAIVDWLVVVFTGDGFAPMLTAEQTVCIAAWKPAGILQCAPASGPRHLLSAALP